MQWKKLLNVVAENSYCKRKQVGAIIARESRIISTGYNGTVAGLDNTCEDSGGNTKSTVVHAEANAILFAAKHGVPLLGATLYVSTAPCVECAKMIRQSGISGVYYLEEYRDTTGLDLLTVSGVKARRME